ncbi:MAG: DUF2293 domain-containing protein [Methylococcaceae bacterium]
MENNHQSQGDPNEIVLFSIINPSVCSECGAKLAKGNFLKMEQANPLCLECADLGHLVYLQRGDAALTRRSKKYSNLSAVVVRFSSSRHRYERQGLLVESEALIRAEKECEGDAADRKISRARAIIVRDHADKEYIAQFSKQICMQYPGCPAQEAQAIADHACQKYSGRVGRSSAAKAFDSEAIELTVKAHVRHKHTHYDQLLSN